MTQLYSKSIKVSRFMLKGYTALTTLLGNIGSSSKGSGSCAVVVVAVVVSTAWSDTKGIVFDGEGWMVDL